MSAVLRKKINAAGGLPQKLLQCAPLWDALMDGAKRWSRKAYSGDLGAAFTARRLLSGKDAETRFADAYAFAPLTKTAGALVAVSMDRAGAARYAALRLHQSSQSLEDASELFLRLMCEQPAQQLWACIQTSLNGPSGAGGDIALGDPSTLTDAIDPSARLVQVGIVLSDGSGEDGWLLEGGEDVPQIKLYFDLAQLETLAERLRAQARQKDGAKAQPDRAGLRSSLRHSSIRLEAILDNVDMSVGDCSRLDVGDVLPLPGVEAGRLTLCAETMNGHAAIGEGEMGNWKGHRALKLNGPVIESFIREIAEI